MAKSLITLVALSCACAAIPTIARADISNYPMVDHFCYMIDQDGTVINLDLVCNPDAPEQAARNAELEARMQAAITDGNPMFCDFLLESATRDDSSVSAQSSIDIPVVCTALMDAEGVSIDMQLRANGNQLIGNAYETVGRVRADDQYTFSATFLGDYIPPVRELEVEYFINGG